MRGECEYHQKAVDEGVLRKLRIKCSRIRPFEKYRIVHCVFSASGFTENAIVDTATDGSLTFDCEELVQQTNN